MVTCRQRLHFRLKYCNNYNKADNYINGGNYNGNTNNSDNYNDGNNYTYNGDNYDNSNYKMVTTTTIATIPIVAKICYVTGLASNLSWGTLLLQGALSQNGRCKPPKQGSGRE